MKIKQKYIGKTEYCPLLDANVLILEGHEKYYLSLKLNHIFEPENDKTNKKRN